jgi:hypothetical protein
MFWKKKPAAEEQLKPKAKKLSPREIIAERIKQLAPGQTISYRLPETYGGELAVVEPNPQYPTKGRMYILSTEKIVDGKPGGQRSRLWDSNKPKDIAGWIIDRGGELFG